MKNCKHCGKEFQPIAKRRKEDYCSELCRSKARALRRSIYSKKINKIASDKNKNTVRVCRTCGKSFLRADGFIKYCSEECRNRAMSQRGSGKRRAKQNNIVFSDSIVFMDVWDLSCGCCEICGIKLDLSKRGCFCDDAPEVDHIIPFTRGGHHAIYNTQILCRSCNQKKGNKLLLSELEKAKNRWPTELTLVDLKKPNTKYLTNKSGVTGVSQFRKGKHLGKWKSKIIYDGVETVRLFNTFEEAVFFRKEMEKKYNV